MAGGYKIWRLLRPTQPTNTFMLAHAIHKYVKQILNNYQTLKIMKIQAMPIHNFSNNLCSQFSWVSIVQIYHLQQKSIIFIFIEERVFFGFAWPTINSNLRLRDFKQLVCQFQTRCQNGDQPSQKDPSTN